MNASPSLPGASAAAPAARAASTLARSDAPEGEGDGGDFAGSLAECLNDAPAADEAARTDDAPQAASAPACPEGALQAWVARTPPPLVPVATGLQVHGAGEARVSAGTAPQAGPGSASVPPAAAAGAMSGAMSAAMPVATPAPDPARPAPAPVAASATAPVAPTQTLPTLPGPVASALAVDVSAAVAAVAVPSPAPGAPAPVHHAELSTHPSEPAFADELATQVRFMADGTLQQAELRLNPQELGPIRIQLALDGDRAEIRLDAALALTREGIERALPQLREALAADGLSLSHAQVGTGQGDAGAAAGEGRRQPPAFAHADRAGTGPGNGNARHGEGHDEGLPAAAAPRLRALPGRLDLYA